MQTLTTQVVVSALCRRLAVGVRLRVRKPHGLEGFACTDKFGTQHAPCTQRLAIAFEGFIDDHKAVAFVHAMEIDVT